MPAVVVTGPGGKINYHGIEVSKQLIWKGWKPGSEYTKNLVLKNVRVKTQKLKFRAPDSRFFSTMYPQPIVLSAGTSFTLPVTLRPLEKKEYFDKIAIETNDGNFEIPLSAVLPKYNIEVPDMINFNMCAAQDSTSLSFQIRNVSELTTTFEVNVGGPFEVEPSRGEMEPFGTFSLTASFHPKAAVVYQSEVIFKYGNNHEKFKIMKLEGIGKYPHLVLSTGKRDVHFGPGTEEVADFGAVAVGNSGEKWIELHNPSPVNAPFKVEQPSKLNNIDTVFHCQQCSGIVPAFSTIRIPFIYTPNMVAAENIEYFTVTTISHTSKNTIKCMGSSKGPKVQLSVSSVNFFQVDAGMRVTKTFEIFNDSDVPAVYQIAIDSNESVFSFDQQSGILPPNDKKLIIIKFAPQDAINYYRRLPIVIHNQEPLFIDLLGTCHNETQKPAILKLEHVKRFNVHTERGLSFLPPEQLNELVHQGKLKKDENGCLTNKEDDESLGISPPNLSSMAEYFNDGYHSESTEIIRHVSLDLHEMDFGLVKMEYQHQQPFTVTNHTKGKILISWMGGEDHVFSISPQTTEIQPLSSAPFSVKFKPRAVNEFYSAQLEGYASYKSMRDYRLVEELTQAPSWCMTLTCLGNTFNMPHNESFLPRLSLDSNKLVFPAVNVGEASYQTLHLANNGTTPLTFDFSSDPSRVFETKPSKGMIEKNHHQIFVLKMEPQEIKAYKHVLPLRFNYMDKNTQDITLIGSSEQASLFLESQAELIFKPTCVGSASQRQYRIKNVSRIPLRFEWEIGKFAQHIMSVEPSSGVILPNEEQYHTWTFIPHDYMKYVLKMNIIAWGQGHSAVSSAGKKQMFTLRAIGEGCEGNIECETPYLDYATVLIGTSSSQQMALVNKSDVNVHYQLSYTQDVVESENNDFTFDESILQLDHHEGVIPAKSRVMVTASVCPLKRAMYEITLNCSVVAPKALKDTPWGDTIPLIGEAKPICKMSVRGVYPVLMITDARCLGSLRHASKRQLWSYFSIDNINASLDTDPSQAEMASTLKSRQGMSRIPSVHTRAIHNINFGASPVDSEASIVQLMVENVGTLPTSWALLFPKDLQLELEYWMETGLYDSEELHQMKIADNKLFSVEPSSGYLEPNANVTLTFTYHHRLIGTDRLPVLLKLAQGREILLNFVGVTLDNDTRYLHFPSSKHMLTPVAIGEQGPVQIYELFNGGALPLKYEIDTSSLDLIQHENYDHPIFQCLNPVGEVLPGYSARIEWIFSPLEQRTYMVDVPIMIHNGSTAVVTFTGVGYDDRASDHLSKDMTLTSWVPSRQSIANVPGQILFLSEERLSLGDVPLSTRLRRVIAMRNKSMEHSATFRWHLTDPKFKPYLTITPHEGYLEPGQDTMVKVIFTACGKPAFYDLDLVCEVVNQTEFGEYRMKLKKWEDENYRRTVEFTCTEDNPNADQDLPEMDEDGRPITGRSQSGRLLKSLELRTPSPESDLSKYQTLPPIRQTSMDVQRRNEKDVRKFRKQYWRRPSPPKAFVLHLGITARTQSTGMFNQQVQSDVRNSFYIDRLLNKNNNWLEVAESSDSGTEDLQIDCIEAESNIVAGTLNSVLRGLLDDAGFHETMDQIASDDIPYYRQIKTEPESTFVQEAQDSSFHEDGKQNINPGVATEEGTHPASPQETSQRCSAKSNLENSNSFNENNEELMDKLSRTSYGEPDIPDENVSEEEKQIKKSPEFGTLLEQMMDNVITNVLEEAFHADFNISARLRLPAVLVESGNSTVTTPKSRSQSQTASRPKGSAKSGTSEPRQNRSPHFDLEQNTSIS